MVGAFSQESSESELSLSLDVSEASEDSVSYTYAWIPPGPATDRTGRTEPPARAGNEVFRPESVDAIERDNLFHGDAPGGRNQCVFVRGYRISLQQSVWSSVMGHPLRATVSSIDNSTPETFPGGNGSFGGTLQWFFTGLLGQGIGGQHSLSDTDVNGSSHRAPEQDVMVDLMTEESDVGGSWLVQTSK
jgi:hypothetical protein